MSLVNFGDCECNIVKAVLFHLQSAGKEVVYAALGLDTPMGDHKVGGGVWRDALLRFSFGKSNLSLDLGLGLVLNFHSTQSTDTKFHTYLSEIYLTKFYVHPII